MSQAKKGARKKIENNFHGILTIKTGPNGRRMSVSGSLGDTNANRLRNGSIVDKPEMAEEKEGDDDNRLFLFTIISVLVGIILGFSLRYFDLPDEMVLLINFPGEIFMQVLKMMILPLVFSSLITALAQMNPRESRQMGLITLCYYLLTTILATMLGIFLVLTIHPGKPQDSNDLLADKEDPKVDALDSLLDLVRNLFPENIFQATFERTQTAYQMDELNGTLWKKVTTPQRGTNILGIIMFCSIFGIVISEVGHPAKPVVDFFISLDTIIIRWVGTLMWFAPLGIASLISGKLLEIQDLATAATSLLVYVLTVLTGFTIHSLITIPVLFFLLTRKNPLFVFKGMLPAFVTAFGTASSGAALPISLKCMNENCKVDNRITRFVIPMGASLNMDGNALYEAVAVVFIAQMHSVQLTMSQVITVSITATLASLGLNAVPAGLVSILLILNTVGLPTRYVALLMTVDWLLDRIRTAINVYGDGFATLVAAHFMKDKMEEADEHMTDFQQELRDELASIRSGHIEYPVYINLNKEQDLEFVQRSNSIQSQNRSLGLLPVTPKPSAITILEYQEEDEC